MAVLKQQTRGASNTGKQIPGQRLGSDEPGAMLSVHTLTSMAPARDGPFVSVPKVLGDGGGA
jgi:Asp-tRNA(Asn)/Glu-tRNA(Gln) amidotransferase C subunit